jgi:hypothetical protein
LFLAFVVHNCLLKKEEEACPGIEECESQAVCVAIQFDDDVIIETTAFSLGGL